MGKGQPGLKPDIVVKNYWRNNEQFADFFNAVLFDGRQTNLSRSSQLLSIMVKKNGMELYPYMEC